MPSSKRKKSTTRARKPKRPKPITANPQLGSPARTADFVVGIGASAGGLPALKSFFAAMPANTGLTFIVIVHLDPAHESLMAELLAHVTGLEVKQATDLEYLEPDHVYIIPPNRTLTLASKRQLRVQEVADRQGLRSVIDHFLRSLAEVEGDRSIAVLLSGTGTEGTLGARAIKAAGGLVMAQAPETASHPGMPSSVIATGIVDVVAGPDGLAGSLVSYARHPHIVAAMPSAGEDKAEDGLPTILAVLRARTKYDFRGYKKGTLRRRIERRMGLQQIGSSSKYAEFLRSNPAEADQLFKDMLIGVTSFFRDPEAFEELSQKVLAELVRERDHDVPIRIWVPGCSTGEEAYSIAIALAEQLTAAQSDARVQIFATDVDEEALETARSGSYPESISLDVTAQRLRRFFTRENHRYTISKAIRESVVFAVQNLTSDPPFSKLDLLSCRNVLIYLEPEMQQKLMALFNFSLNPGGYLFLGSAEGVGGLDDLFVPISKNRRIFRRIGPITTRPAMEPLMPSTNAAEVATKSSPESTMATLADQQLLQHFSPAALVVRANGHIVRFYGTTERYIKLPTGEATFDVLTLARDPLKPTLRAALYEAVRRGRQTALETLDLARGRERTTLRITVRPLDKTHTAEGYWLIIFEELSAPAAGAATRQKGNRQTDLVRRLEQELRATKREQQQLIEQLESGNEELKAANEEVLSMNEELQSTNEELTTSREELQSMNEELTTLNAQLQDKVQELTTVNDALANLLVSTDIATVFLDMQLRIKRFTTAASLVLNLQSADVGRPLNHIASNLVDIDLSGDAGTVLRTLVPIEKEATSRDGKQYLLRSLPYRTAKAQVQGVVLTLVDVTTLKRVERDLSAAREQVAEDLRRMTRLHEVGARLAGPGDTRSLLEEVLRATLEITDAQMGTIQMCDADEVLTIAAQIGFQPPFLDFFTRVDRHTDSMCGRSISSRTRTVAEDVSASPVFTGKPSLQVMLAAGVQAVQSTPLFDRAGRFVGMFSTHYREPHRFGTDELRWLDLLARHAGDVLEWQRTEALARSHDDLEKRVADRTKWLSLMHEISRAISETPVWDGALQRVLQRICEVEGWQVGYVHLPDPPASDFIAPRIAYCEAKRFQLFHDFSQQCRLARGQSLAGLVYRTGVPQWVNDAEPLLGLLPVRGSLAQQVGLRAAVALPITLGSEVIAVLELFSDQSHPPNEQLAMLMRDVSDQISRVLERERTTARIADLIWREQQDLLHALHDTLGQTLTGLGMLSAGLRERLADADPSAAETAAEIARQATQALNQVRQLSKGLFPAEVDAASLVAALQDLASATESLHGIQVQVQSQGLEGMHDGTVSTQLYRIAQEAVTNAVRHAQPRNITIQLDGSSGVTRLQVADDGVGILKTEPSKGMGLKIMRYRASSIGGLLTIEPATAGGTIVTCTLPAGLGSAPAP